MRIPFFILTGTLCLLISSRAFPASFEMSRSVYDSDDLAFESHVGAGAFDNYLIELVAYTPVKQVFDELQSMVSTPLKNRGEAHITVITPVEYSQVLKSKMTMDTINAIAVANRIQKAHFRVVCVGKGSYQGMDTYFLVLDSSDLLRLRKKIHEKFVGLGGDPAAFNYRLFFPHITVGFTQQDLHYEQGVIKDRNSCIGDVKVL